VRDPRQRLGREVLGESVLVPRRMLDKVLRKEVVRECMVTLPDRNRGRVVIERPYAHIPEPGPNAPKLIRLIRNPATQELGRPVRNTDISRRTATQWMKPESARLVREALASRELPTRPKPTRERVGAPARPRVSVEAWLLQGENQ